MTGRMQWDDAAKSILLVLLLETHEITVDYNKLAESWPGTIKPTPRAIREQVSKMRKETSGGRTGGAPATPGTPSTPASSRKGRGKVTKASAGSHGSPSQLKRKRVTKAKAKDEGDPSDEDAQGTGLSPAKTEERENLEGGSLQPALKDEDIDAIDT